jgi:hypothetical protein
MKGQRLDGLEEASASRYQRLPHPSDLYSIIPRWPTRSNDNLFEVVFWYQTVHNTSENSEGARLGVGCL